PLHGIRVLELIHEKEADAVLVEAADIFLLQSLEAQLFQVVEIQNFPLALQGGEEPAEGLAQGEQALQGLFLRLFRQRQGSRRARFSLQERPVEGKVFFEEELLAQQLAQESLDLPAGETAEERLQGGPRLQRRVQEKLL